MGYWDYFSRGLLQSFSWKDGYDNALLREVPGELGVFSHSLLAVLITFLIFYGLNIAKLKAGSWKALINKEYQKTSKICISSWFWFTNYDSCSCFL